VSKCQVNLRRGEEEKREEEWRRKGEEKIFPFENHLLFSSIPLLLFSITQ